MLQRLGNGAEEVVRRVLAGLLAGNQRLFTFRRAIAQLVTPAVAEWLVVQHNSNELMQLIATFGTPEVRAALTPHLGGFVQLQDAAAILREQQYEQQQARERRHLTDKQDVIRTSPDFGQYRAP